ncbi:hypothetical protein D3800_15385 [Microcystis aeruginosa NIES-298]|uniref:Uncharacterized protein n=1 Tax=Microcystis aeruginosa NIES-298 TaxID=449468 RepID=A0A2H6BX52_MICAE|nr:hypothetical protein [Microcystis aeruginosa]QHU84583.1 hypothetical protein D3800_15385 [Microcystis aeruginosa NIES-298]GBD54754.1 hypothetical protein BGM30_38470 [Microcystis aeruginosa NIES-298]GBE95759.1 hypothetical protein NIES298_00090 [Microcystis aeruginosa NIES-298]
MTSTTSTPNLPTQAQWDAANQFLQELLINNNLAQGYLNIAQQANGQDNAPTRLTDWLQGQGYDTTPALIYGALVAVQNTTLGYWLGIYGQSYQQTGTISTDAPVLCILPDINGNITPYLNGVALVNYTFKSVESDGSFNPILSWGLESNSTAGEITFYYTPEVNTDPNPPTGYTGNWFQGTLQTGANAPQESFFGALGSANAEALPTVSLSGEDPHQQQSESWLKQTIAWLNAHPAAWVGVGIGGLVVAVGLIYGGYKLARWAYQSIQQCQQEREQARQEINNDFQNDSQEEIDPLEQGIRVRVENQPRQRQQQIIHEEEEEESDAEIESLEQGIRQEVQNEQRQLEEQPAERYPNVFDNPRMTLKDVEKTRIFQQAQNQLQKPELKNLDSVSNLQNPDAYIHQGESDLQGIQDSAKFPSYLNQEEPLLQSLILSEDAENQNIDHLEQKIEYPPSYPQRVLDLPKAEQWHLLSPHYQQQLQENLGKRLNRLVSFGENPQPPSQFQPNNLDDNDLNASQNLNDGNSSQDISGNDLNASQNLKDGNSGIDQSTMLSRPTITQQQTSQKVDVNQKGSTSQQSQPNPLSDQKIQQVEQKNQSSDQDSNDGGDEIEGEEGK